jgi:hypothetical protein
VRRCGLDSSGLGEGSVAGPCPCALTELHAMKAYCRSGGIAPRILDFGTRWSEHGNEPLGSIKGGGTS